MINTEQLKKMLEVTEDFYGTVDDPEQILIGMDSFHKLMTLSKEAIQMVTDKNGDPISWVVVVPTSTKVMELFLEGKISESELFEQAVEEKKFEALYLCSVFTMPEYRGKGYASELLKNTIKEFAPSGQPLFAWNYSKEGGSLISKLVKDLGREIKLRKS